MSKYSSIELCAGAGGQALGIEQAGFEHVALVEIDRDCCNTLGANRRAWKGKVRPEGLEIFLRDFARSCKGVDLVAGGLPCPPFSKAGKQLGENDERNLFPVGLDIIEVVQPRAVMIENVRGILDPAFADFRRRVLARLADMGFRGEWKLHQSSDFGVPQLRPRAILVALREELWPSFVWPVGGKRRPPSVGDTLFEAMSRNGWTGAEAWRDLANGIAPTIVGGSKKHGGPDLGPTRARKAWAAMGVNGKTIAEDPPAADFSGQPRLTVEMVALLQGFPRGWRFEGKKTAAYRQVGNAFPPPVAKAVAKSICRALDSEKTTRRRVKPRPVSLFDHVA
jgi:DNA (cytosine-5)-methyltransferase 1